MRHEHLYELSVLVNGKEVKEFLHKDKVYIEGRKGTSFSIRVKNNGYDKILAVLTVDGKSIVNGNVGDMNKNGGYIVSPRDSVVIPGWRLNDNEVAQFVFESSEQSYAAQSDGTTQNLGVIGCAIFKEQVTFAPLKYVKSTTEWPNTGSTWSDTSQPTSRGLYSTSASVDSIPCCAMASCIGTGFGLAKEHRTTATNFTRRDTPETVMVMTYDTRDGLKRRGVVFNPPVQIAPSPFPANEQKVGCVPPKGWKRQ